jgi:hypothetical protein
MIAMNTSLDPTKLTGWSVNPNDPKHVIVDSYWDNLLHCGGSVGITCHTPRQARLAASAPALLAALQDAARCLAEYRRTGHMPGWDISLRNAEAAIAKATTP